MATLRKKRKLAAVSRETPESTRNSRRQSTLDPDLTQDYISQVSEEIEVRVTKKLSKEVSRTESRILGALSKLDKFLLNPQVRTCSVAVPGTSRNNNSENRETTGDRSSDNPAPKRGPFLATLVKLTAQRQKPTLTDTFLVGACKQARLLEWFLFFEPLVFLDFIVLILNGHADLSPFPDFCYYMWKDWSLGNN